MAPPEKSTLSESLMQRKWLNIIHKKLAFEPLAVTSVLASGVPAIFCREYLTNCCRKRTNYWIKIHNDLICVVVAQIMLICLCSYFFGNFWW